MLAVVRWPSQDMPLSRTTREACRGTGKPPACIEPYPGTFARGQRDSRGAANRRLLFARGRLFGTKGLGWRASDPAATAYSTQLMYIQQVQLPHRQRRSSVPHALSIGGRPGDGRGAGAFNGGGGPSSLSKDPTSQRNGDEPIDPSANPCKKCRAWVAATRVPTTHPRRMGSRGALQSCPPRAKDPGPCRGPGCRMAVDALRRTHFVPFGNYVLLELTLLRSSASPQDRLSLPREPESGSLSPLFHCFPPDNFIPGFLAHIPRKGPHTVRWMIW